MSAHRGWNLLDSRLWAGHRIEDTCADAFRFVLTLDGRPGGFRVMESRGGDCAARFILSRVHKNPPYPVYLCQAPHQECVGTPDLIYLVSLATHCESA